MPESPEPYKDPYVCAGDIGAYLSTQYSLIVCSSIISKLDIDTFITDTLSMREHTTLSINKIVRLSRIAKDLREAYLELENAEA